MNLRNSDAITWLALVAMPSISEYNIVVMIAALVASIVWTCCKYIEADEDRRAIENAVKNARASDEFNRKCKLTANH